MLCSQLLCGYGHHCPTLQIRQRQPREAQLLAHSHTVESGSELNSLSPGLTLFTVGLSFKVVFNAIYLNEMDGGFKIVGHGEAEDRAQSGL